MALDAQESARESPYQGDSGGASIRDYALIGDCRSAALVSNRGSIDWLCLPRFSSPSVFGALLDTGAGGRFQVAPVAGLPGTHRYVPGTNVLETTWQTRDGVLRLTDAMSIPPDDELQPMREVLRVVEGVRGRNRVRLTIDPRPDYGRRPATLRARARRWVWTWGSDWLSLDSEIPLRAEGSSLVGECVVEEGQKLWASLIYSQGDIGVVPARGVFRERLDGTLQFWASWSARIRYDGPYRDHVTRSALTLKMLTHVLSGAVMAAPSMSLPEAIGGDRNWDYRYCWLRDAAFTMRAFTGLGYYDEARAFLDWLLHATRLTWPDLQVLYDEYGRTHLPETELVHWRGYRDSRPVRVGNAALEQVQLDVYGAVCLAAREFVAATDELARDEARLLYGFGRTACRLSANPDHGIWEIRGERRHYTFSKVMCWTALDALVDFAKRGLFAKAHDFTAARDALRDLVESRGFNRQIDSYVAVLDGNTVDSSLLLMSSLGFREATDARMRGTFARVNERLGRRGVLYRYEYGLDGIAAHEGAFGLCTFWAVEHLARRGDVDLARVFFERMLGLANAVKLFSEEVDPDSGELLGNFPQAYTHVGVINAALALERARGASHG